jgi:AcrR family transcriptional regulator
MERSPGRVHPRGAKVRAAVLAATLAELAATGYAALTIEAVAQRADVHKTTVYRRWPDREALVIDALTDHVATERPIPDTGTIEGDLRELARSLARLLAKPDDRAVMSVLFSDAARLPEIAQIKRQFYVDRIQRGAPVVARAVERGELPAQVDPEELLKTLIAPLHLRLLATEEPVDEDAADRAVEVTLAAARAGALNRR